MSGCVSVSSKKSISKDGRLIINGQELFLSGMNPARMHFGRDLVDFRDDDITKDPVEARYVKMFGMKRGAQWGFSLWQCEVNAAE
ncbi:MAG: hypothetical protein JXJ04_02490 [Spirochaetales bacterium]|nr:hypothetical protein [Spirochaetales bacterium]